MENPNRDMNLWLSHTIDEIEGEEFTNRKNDRGKKTKFGITEKFLRDSGYLDVVVEHMDRAFAEYIYEIHFWLELKCDRMPVVIAWCYADAAVNHGQRHAAKMIQGALGIKRDGVIGSESMKAIQEVSDTYVFWRKYRELRTRFYIRFARSNLEQMENVNGWMNRLFLLGEGLVLNYFKMRYK